MKFGMTGLNAGPGAQPGYATAAARILEDAGFESIWTVEHVVVPANYGSQYPYSRDGKMPGGEDTAITDPLVWLAFVAATTTRINLATGILILPQRNPVLLAKETATLDVLSGGRLVLGIGVGWLREEFDALGVPFEDRGASTDDYVAALRALWTQGEPTHQGSFAKFDKAKSYPKPSRSIPIVVGGHSDAAARRAGTYADGFFPYSRDIERDTALYAVMRAAARDAGRSPDDIEITAMGRPDAEKITRYAEAGATRYILPPLGFDIETLKRAVGDFAAAAIV